MQLTESLAAAGLLVLQDGEPDAGPGGYIPPLVAGQASSCPAEDGRIDSQVDIDDPLLLEKANADWYRLSVREGLFTETDRRFLLTVTPEKDGPAEWIRVRLQDPWDIMGAGASGPLGSRSGRPEFLMLSLDGEVLCCGTTWQHAIGTFVVKAPHRSRILRRFAEYVATGEIGHPAESAAARRWLGSAQWE